MKSLPHSAQDFKTTTGYRPVLHTVLDFSICIGNSGVKDEALLLFSAYGLVKILVV